jgi:hypothetical protein
VSSRDRVFGGKEPPDPNKSLYRRRMQQQPVQQSEGGLPTRSAGEVPHGEIDQRAVKFLISFVRHLVSTLSSDHIILAVGAAAVELGVPRELAQSILPSILGYQKRNSIWPKGFMP